MSLSTLTVLLTWVPRTKGVGKIFWVYVPSIFFD